MRTDDRICAVCGDLILEVVPGTVCSYCRIATLVQERERLRLDLERARVEIARLKREVSLTGGRDG